MQTNETTLRGDHIEFEGSSASTEATVSAVGVAEEEGEEGEIVGACDGAQTPLTPPQSDNHHALTQSKRPRPSADGEKSLDGHHAPRTRQSDQDHVSDSAAITVDKGSCPPSKLRRTEQG